VGECDYRIIVYQYHLVVDNEMIMQVGYYMVCYV
jgi:hypothetical protein